MPVDKKRCSCVDCASRGRPLPVSEFSKNAQTVDGLAYYCRPCNALKQRQWKIDNPEKVKRWKKAYRKHGTQVGR